MKEVAYMHSEGILSGELKHGPLALIDKDMPVVMVISSDGTYDVRILIFIALFIYFFTCYLPSSFDYDTAHDC